MRMVAGRHADWPNWLSSLRTLVAVLRNHSRRAHWARVVRRPEENAKQMLAHLLVSFAKWRYETIAVVLEALLPLRRICEVYVQAEIFKNCQDRALLAAFARACKDQALWRWIKVRYETAYFPLEHWRRWGMVCGCPDRTQMRKDGMRHIECGRNSRRLGEAVRETNDVAKDFLQRAK